MLIFDKIHGLVFSLGQSRPFTPAGISVIVGRSHHSDPPVVVLDHGDLGIALCCFDIGGDVLQELQFGRFPDAVPVIKDALKFNDQAMFDRLV